MKSVILLLLAAAAASAQPRYADHFTDRTLRIDYYHVGDAKEDLYTLNRMLEAGPWAGSTTNLLEPFSMGRSAVTIRDRSGELLYSRGFDTYFGEYRTTAPARQGTKRTFQESVLIPFPKHPVTVSIESRDRRNVYRPVWTLTVDPNDYHIHREGVNRGGRVIPVIHGGDPARSVDLVFVAEGYTAAEEGKFAKDLRAIVDTLFTLEPYRRMKERFNVSGVFHPSPESGVDEPQQRSYKSTSLGFTFNSLESDRYLLTEEHHLLRDAAGQVPYDLAIALVNKKRYGGGGIYNFFAVFTSDGTWPDYVFHHEFAHAFAGLADEYYSAEETYEDFYPAGVEPAEPNLTALLDPEKLKWKELVSPGLAIPTEWGKKTFDSLYAAHAPGEKLKAFFEQHPLRGKVGAFEGGGYTSKGLYRPTVNSIMHQFNPTDRQFYAVNERAVERMIRWLCGEEVTPPDPPVRERVRERERVTTRADTLRGAWSPERACTDVKFYSLDVRINPADSSVQGSNEIRFSVVAPSPRLQLDLFRNMAIHRVTIDGGETPLDVTRDEDAFFVALPPGLLPGTEHTLRVEYGGKPRIARNPPWDGGFTWTQDSSGSPWVVVTCQGTGASLWWPTKDHQADEPDSMAISVTVPPGLEDVSNGRLRRVVTEADGWKRYEWFVGSPINTYSVTVNVGRYAHFREWYVGGDSLSLDYFVLPQNLQRARKHFAQVREMMRSFEKAFGPYPFIRDGFKLVDSPHTGMEHQSAVAYGNKYLGGYRGRASSRVGLDFDFIIIHESAHEWWGNSITAKDPADMWIHESFGAYAEALFVESRAGYRESLRYINGKRDNVGNRTPIVGTPGLNRPGSGDMYDKGQLVLNTLRSVIDNDTLWFGILRGLQQKSRHSTVTGDEIIGYIQSRTGKGLGYFFDQYLRQSAIPLFEAQVTEKGKKVTVRYRWRAETAGFRMPLRVTTGKNRWGWITPTSEMQTLELKGIGAEEFRVDSDRFYVEERLRRGYLDPRLPD